ncbi:MAG TPA: hypothetical protein VFH30_12665 [Acidimicrobiales bacterium]|nr:hypothetical protein [Acidimicrobiales bacterium]
MNGTDSLDALRRANPRHKPDFTRMATDLTRAAADPRPPAVDASHGRARRSPRSRRPWLVIGVPAAASLAAVVVVAVLAVGSPTGSPAVSPAAAIEQAATVSAQAAEQSGTVSIEVTQNGDLWGARTVRWNGSDISVTNEDPGRVGRADLVVVDGTLYGPDPATADGWFELGSPASIDPDSGTTPDEYLATVREDAGGDTFRRITEAMTDLTTSPGDDGSVVYRGTVPAGVLAWETGTKGGAPIRVLPYGYVAHDDASDPAAPVDVRITVRADGTIEEIHAAWGGASSWSYRLSFSDLGSTPAPTAPENPRRLCVERGIPCPPPIAPPDA